MSTLVKHAWLFDVDGVITHSGEKRVTEPKIIKEIIKRLENQEPVAFITGRSLKWLTKIVLDQIKAKIEDRALLKNLIVLVEFGSIVLTFKDGKPKTKISTKIAIPKSLIEKVEEIVKENFARSMFLDKTKKTLITTEIHDNFELDEFKSDQQELVKKLQELLKEQNLTEKLIVHSDRLGVNIRSKSASKFNATKKVISWIKNKGTYPIFVIFGDSASDLEIAQAVFESGLDFKFVFVGEKELLDDLNLSFPVIFTQSLCEKGTLEYLTTHQN